jgi:hypothetical protein
MEAKPNEEFQALSLLSNDPIIVSHNISYIKSKHLVSRKVLQSDLDCLLQGE